MIKLIISQLALLGLRLGMYLLFFFGGLSAGEKWAKQLAVALLMVAMILTVIFIK